MIYSLSQKKLIFTPRFESWCTIIMEKITYKHTQAIAHIKTMLAIFSPLYIIILLWREKNSKGIVKILRQNINIVETLSVMILEDSVSFIVFKYVYTWRILTSHQMKHDVGFRKIRKSGNEDVIWRGRRDLNSRPLAWQASVLSIWTTTPPTG
jgi:hypothetical protein